MDFEVAAEEDERWGEAYRGDELPEELQRREKRLAAIQAAKARLEAAQRARDDERGREPGQDRHPRGGRPYKRAYGEPEPKAQSNFTDPQSPIMKTSSEGFQQCYNAQMAVDGEHQMIVATRVGPQANDQGQLVGLLDGINETFGVEPAVVLADAGYCNEADLLELEDRGIDAHVALGREGKSKVAVDPARLPATHRMGEKLASLAGKAQYAQRQVALGGAERVGQGGAWIPTIQPARLGEGARRVGSGVLGVEHQANGDAGHVLRQVLACQRTGSGARSAHRPRMKHQSLAFQPCGLGVPSQSRTGPHIHSRAKIPPLQRPRDNRPSSTLLRRTLLVGPARTSACKASRPARLPLYSISVSRYGLPRSLRVSTANPLRVLLAAQRGNAALTVPRAISHAGALGRSVSFAQ